MAELALPAEAELQRLSADGARLEAAMEASPGLLRGYVRLLILQYRQTRSAFYVPPAAVLERRLTSLLEVDPQHARLYQLFLGELAWDRGDDDRFIELSRRAVERVEASDSVSPFELDPASAQQMLARLMDTLWSRGAGTEVVAIARQAMSAGLAGPGAGQPDPWLEVMCHRAALAGALMQRAYCAVRLSLAVGWLSSVSTAWFKFSPPLVAWWLRGALRARHGEQA